MRATEAAKAEAVAKEAARAEIEKAAAAAAAGRLTAPAKHVAGQHIAEYKAGATPPPKLCLYYHWHTGT